MPSEIENLQQEKGALRSRTSGQCLHYAARTRSSTLASRGCRKLGLPMNSIAPARHRRPCNEVIYVLAQGGEPPTDVGSIFRQAQRSTGRRPWPPGARSAYGRPCTVRRDRQMPEREPVPNSALSGQAGAGPHRDVRVPLVARPSQNVCLGSRRETGWRLSRPLLRVRRPRAMVIFAPLLGMLFSSGSRGDVPVEISRGIQLGSRSVEGHSRT